MALLLLPQTPPAPLGHSQRPHPLSSSWVPAFRPVHRAVIQPPPRILQVRKTHSPPCVRRPPPRLPHSPRITHIRSFASARITAEHDLDDMTHTLVMPPAGITLLPQ